MAALLLVNGTVVNEGQSETLDILIEGERIERVGSGPTPPGAEVVDIAGYHVLPGVIDDQVHFREPGLTHKADIASESKAAIRGGVTSFLDMPNNSPPCVDREGLAAKRAIAARTSHANYGFYLGATNSNIDEIRRITSREACAVKVFMGASTGDMLVDDERTLDSIFADSPLPIATHCEDSPMIWAAERRARAKFGEAVPISEHPRIRSAEACYKSSSLAVELAKRHDARLHVLHLTTAREMSLFESGPIDGKRITAEVCVHHLWYDDTDYDRLGTLIKCNPAIKTAQDRAALRDALVTDKIDVIATDHAPHTREEKAQPYFDAPAGLPLIQHSLPMMLDLRHRGLISIGQVVEKMAHNPARLFRVIDRGFIREGYMADLAVVDLAATVSVRAEDLAYKCGWSPLEGAELRGSVVKTVLGGRVVHDRGWVEARPLGRALDFASPTVD